MSAIGLWFGVQPYPQSNALYEVSVRQARYLPPASSRFHLAMDTLAIGYAIPAIRAHSGLSPVRHCSCQAYTSSFISASQRRSLYRSADIETSSISTMTNLASPVLYRMILAAVTASTITQMPTVTATVRWMMKGLWSNGIYLFDSPGNIYLEGMVPLLGFPATGDLHCTLHHRVQAQSCIRQCSWWTYLWWLCYGSSVLWPVSAVRLHEQYDLHRRLPDDVYLHGHQTDSLYGHWYYRLAHLRCGQSMPHRQNGFSSRKK